METQLLEDISLFAGLSPTDLELLERSLHVEQYRAGQEIFASGTTPAALYLIRSGHVHLMGQDGSILAHLGPGSLFGEADLLRGVQRSIGASTDTDVELWSLADGDLRAVIAQRPIIGVQISRNFGGPIDQLAKYVAGHLRGVPGWGELGEEERRTIARRLQARYFHGGQIIYHHGELPYALYVIESGRVALVNPPDEDEDEYLELEDGDVFGDSAVLSGKPYRHTARTVSDTLLWVLSRTALEKLEEELSGLRARMSRHLRVRLSRMDRERAIPQLRTVPLFSDLPRDALEALARRLVLAHAPAGEFIFRSGERGDALYLVESGMVKLSVPDEGHGESLATVGPGGFFGETSLLTGATRSFDAQAVNDSNLWVLYRHDFEQLLTAYPILSTAVSQGLAERLVTEDNRFTNSHLRHIALFDGLSRAQLDEVVERIKPDRFRAGEVIYRAGEVARALYLIERGEVTLISEDGGAQRVLATLKAGDFFGEGALLEERPRSTTALAATNVEMWQLPRDEFNELVRRYPALGLNLSRGLSRRLDGQPASVPQSQAVFRPEYAAPSPSAPPRTTPRPARPQRWQPGSQGSILDSLRNALDWFDRRTTWTKIQLLLLVILLVWLFGVVAPAALLQLFLGG